MSGVFDDETTLEDSCETNADGSSVFPSDTELLTAAKARVSDTIANINFPQDTNSLRRTLDNWDTVDAEMSNAKKTINDNFILNCLSDEELQTSDCCPFNAPSGDFSGDFCGTLRYNNPTNVALQSFGATATQSSTSGNSGTYAAQKAIDGVVQGSSSAQDDQAGITLTDGVIPSGSHSYSDYPYLQINLGKNYHSIREVVIYSARQSPNCEKLTPFKLQILAASGGGFKLNKDYTLDMCNSSNNYKITYTGIREGNLVTLKKTANEDLSVREVEVYIAEVVPGLPTKQDYRNAILAAMNNTVEVTAASIEGCFARECGLDTKVRPRQSAVLIYTLSWSTSPSQFVSLSSFNF